MVGRLLLCMQPKSRMPSGLNTLCFHLDPHVANSRQLLSEWNPAVEHQQTVAKTTAPVSVTPPLLLDSTLWREPLFTMNWEKCKRDRTCFDSRRVAVVRTGCLGWFVISTYSVYVNYQRLPGLPNYPIPSERSCVTMLHTLFDRFSCVVRLLTLVWMWFFI